MYDSTKELHMDRVLTEEAVASCRNHIETLHNLSYLTALDAESPTQVRLNVRLMEWHIRNIAELLLRAVMLPARHR
jgi:hypothetical protein